MAMQQGKASSRRTTRLACKPTRGICRLLRASIPTVVGPAARGGVPAPGSGRAFPSLLRNTVHWK